MAETMDQALERRFKAIMDWLREEAPYIDSEQKHLDADTAERAYWHYGYATALRDVRRALAEQAAGEE